MKKLDFSPAKSKEDFRKNYKLHDLAEFHGKNLLTQWGIDFSDFGKDNRYQKVWEKGKDKPDIIAEYNELKFMIDWKGKSKEAYWVTYDKILDPWTKGYLGENPKAAKEYVSNAAGSKYRLAT